MSDENIFEGDEAMTGLEKIKEKILAQSKTVCDEIIIAANEEAKNILINARHKASELNAEIIKNAEVTADRKNMLAKSSAETITRNRYLEVRNAIINDVISAAYEEIEHFSDEEYFDILRKLCVKNITPGEFVMQLNSVDLARLPENFEDSINSLIYEKSAVFIKKEAADIENGFILITDGVEINCTFRALFDANMDNLRDMLNSFLFN